MEYFLNSLNIHRDKLFNSNDIDKNINGGNLMNYQEKIKNFFLKTDREILLLFMKVGTGKTLTSLACAIESLNIQTTNQSKSKFESQFESKFESQFESKFENVNFAGRSEGLSEGLFIEQFKSQSVGQSKTRIEGQSELKKESKDYKHIIILSPKSVQHEFKSNLKLYQSFQKYNESINNKIKMIAYNSNNAQEKFRNLNIKDDCIVIIDELHLFVRSVIKVNLLENQTKNNVGNCKRILDEINKFKHKKVLGLTGTPSAKMPFEMVPFFNIDKNINLPENIVEFNAKYINDVTKEINNKNELKRILKNTVVYVDKIDHQQLKSTDLIQEEIQMSVNQYKQYLKDYKKELDELSFTNKKNIYGIPFGVKSTFHCKTFQDSIYVSDLRRDFNTYIDNEHCPKIIKMFDDSNKINGLCAFYFRFVEFGVKTMEAKLIKEGFKLFNYNKKFNFEPIHKGKHYILFTGNESSEYRNKLKEIYNSSQNKYGEFIKYIILSPSGSVGVTLKNVRYLGIGSVEFNYSMIAQIMGRVNRLNSHIDLPIKDRTLENKIYISVKNEKYYNKHQKEINKLCSRTAYQYEKEKALCIERIIFQDSIHDDILNENFRKLLEEISVI